MLAQCEKSSARYNLFICTLQRVKVNKYGITSSLKILPKSTLWRIHLQASITFENLWNIPILPWTPCRQSFYIHSLSRSDNMLHRPFMLNTHLHNVEKKFGDMILFMKLFGLRRSIHLRNCDLVAIRVQKMRYNK